MAKKPKVTVDSARVVTVHFGKTKPTFAEVAEVGHRHGLSDYRLDVYNADGTPFTYDGRGPDWVAKFTRRERTRG